MHLLAYEILSNPKRRRAFDSVDPTFDNNVPPISTYNKENFYDVFGPIFEANARQAACDSHMPLMH